LEFKYGLLPDMGSTEWLTRLIGPSKTKELMFTAAQIEADEALRLGIANRLVANNELESATEALANQLAAAPPLAVKHVKEAVNAAYEPGGKSATMALQGQMECLRSQDFREAGKAFLEKCEPVYQGR
jgi:enoyl-CoA hydratase/carnithine racemase